MLLLLIGQENKEVTKIASDADKFFKCSIYNRIFTDLKNGGLPIFGMIMCAIRDQFLYDFFLICPLVTYFQSRI